MRIHADCQNVFEAYDFPGNIRELRNGLERAMLISGGSDITHELLPALWQTTPRKAPHLMSLEDVEREHIAEVLRQIAHFARPAENAKNVAANF